MKNLGLLLSGLFSVSTMFHGVALAEPSKATSAASKAGWSKKMRDLEVTLQELLIDVSSDERFNSPKNQKRIDRNAERLANLAHSLESKDAVTPDQDPMLPLVARLFAKEVDHAQQSLKYGHRAYARNSIRSLTNYCIACHTRNASGPEFKGLDLNPALSSLKPLEKGNYLASIRSFDRSIEEYEKILSQANTNSFEVERAARAALAIAVRVKRDPDKTMSLVERIISLPNSPYFLKEQATQWKQTIGQWKHESKRDLTTEEELYNEARRLITDARTMQKYPLDRSADVLYLRASGVLHDLLSKYSKGKHTADAFYLTGLSYEVLQSTGIWDLHEFYFLACINQAPHSDTSRRCFKHYQESVYAGYTGSSGTFLPGETQKKLAELEDMSNPAPKEPKDTKKLK